jgi:beta-phosphoglucomutase-like phosphatase (HAD superfamily)
MHRATSGHIPRSETRFQQPSFDQFSSATVDSKVGQAQRAEAYHYLINLRDGTKKDLTLSLKLLARELSELGREATALDGERYPVQNAIAQVNDFLRECQLQPYETGSLAALEQSSHQMQGTLGQLMARAPDATNLGRLLERELQDFSQCADNFFIYEVGKYAIRGTGSLNGSKVPLNYDFAFLNNLTGNQPAFILDVDDCLVMSEECQRKAWGIAISLWAQSEGFSKKDPEGVRKLVRTVEYCLEKDSTAGLLSLLCSICAHRGLLFEQFPGMSREASLESLLNDYRAEVMVMFVEVGEIDLMPGAKQLLKRLKRDEKIMSCCSNTPEAVGVPMLGAVISRHKDLPSFDELILPQHRVYGDCGLRRKPYPDMWLRAAKMLNVRPSEAVIFDNSLNNCVGASCLANHMGDVHLANGRLLQYGDEFAGIVGVLNGRFSDIQQWETWASPSTGRPVKATLVGIDRLFR